MTSSRTSPIALSRGDYENLRRVHITDPLKWGVEVGTDYWLFAGANGQGTASGQNLLTDGGWTLTSIAAHAAGSAADFMTKSDVGTPSQFTTDAAADLIKSPAVFGDYAHAHAAAVIMGRTSLPTLLILDAYARMSVHSADEATSNLGFVEDGGSIVTAADAMATFYSNSATFGIQANASVGVGVTALDTASHWFRIVMNKVTGYSYFSIDGVDQGSLAITADEFPVAFGAGNGTTNRWQLNQAHIFYAWNLPKDPQFF